MDTTEEVLNLVYLTKKDILKLSGLVIDSSGKLYHEDKLELLFKLNGKH